MVPSQFTTDDEMETEENISFVTDPEQEHTEESLESLYCDYPNLIMLGTDYTKWSYLMNSSPIPFLLEIQCPNYPSMKQAHVSCLQGERTLNFFFNKVYMDQILIKSKSLGSLLTLLESNFAEKDLIPFEVDSSEVLEVLGVIGWHSVESLSDDLGSASLSYVDERGVKHLLQIEFLGGTEVQVSHSLPPQIWSPPPPSEIALSSLPDVYREWISAVNGLVPAWESLRELDRLCCLLDPDPPGPQHLYRRLVVAPSLTLHLTIDPACPLALPSIKFLGADNKVAPLRDALSRNLDLWEEDLPLLNNLEVLLEVELPTRAGSSTLSPSDWGVECGICYSYTLEQELPSVACEDLRCGQPFHPSCLFTWLANLQMQGARAASNLATGECPYCSKPITCFRP